MNKKWVYALLIFAGGTTFGSVVTWKILKEKYADIAQEEIDSVKEIFSRKIESDTGVVRSSVLENGRNDGGDEIKQNVNRYADIISDNGYLEKVVEGDISMNESPYVIAPDDFGDCDYETVSLTYYADGVLADEFDDICDDVDELIGVDSLNRFGEYEDDSVFVRNDALKQDFEILRDEKKYSDLYPYHAEV